VRIEVFIDISRDILALRAQGGPPSSRKREPSCPGLEAQALEGRSLINFADITEASRSALAVEVSRSSLGGVPLVSWSKLCSRLAGASELSRSRLDLGGSSKMIVWGLMSKHRAVEMLSHPRQPDHLP